MEMTAEYWINLGLGLATLWLGYRNYKLSQSQAHRAALLQLALRTKKVVHGVAAAILDLRNPLSRRELLTRRECLSAAWRDYNGCLDELDAMMGRSVVEARRSFSILCNDFEYHYAVVLDERQNRNGRFGEHNLRLENSRPIASGLPDDSFAGELRCAVAKFDEALSPYLNPSVLVRMWNVLRRSNWWLRLNRLARNLFATAHERLITKPVEAIKSKASGSSHSSDTGVGHGVCHGRRGA
jgi:hypothetical protein